MNVLACMMGIAEWVGQAEKGWGPGGIKFALTFPTRILAMSIRF